VPFRSDIAKIGIKRRIPTAWSSMTIQSSTQPITSFSKVDTDDPGISWGSANQCILGDVYPRSNLLRKVVTKALVSSLKGRRSQICAGHSHEVHF